MSRPSTNHELDIAIAVLGSMMVGVSVLVYIALNFLPSPRYASMSPLLTRTPPPFVPDWDGIKMGMDRTQVEVTIGKPAEVYQENMWKYRDGDVLFDKNEVFLWSHWEERKKKRGDDDEEGGE